jgi:hypothetical protein
MKSKIKIITDPKQERIKVRTVSALVTIKEADKYRKGKDEHPTVQIKLFNINNPHKTTEFPHTVYEYHNIEKVRIRRLNVSYYLAGEDVVINDLEELYIIHEGTKILLKAYQFEVESRQNAKEKKK